MKRAIGWLLVLTVALFWQFFRYGQYPVPGNYLIAWYEPWRSENSSNNFLQLSHKAVADDVVRQIYPFKKLATDIILNGQFPIWNPYNGAGQPLLATMHPGFLNPFSFVMLLWPNGFGWSLFIVFQPLLLGVAMYVYLRQLKISAVSALFGSSLIMLSGVATTRYVYGDYMYAFAGLPGLLYLFESYIQDGKRRIWFLPLIVSFLCFSVQPQIILYILGFFFCYVFFRCRSWRVLAYMAVLAGIGMLIAGVQLVPTIELYLLASITSSSSTFIFQKFLLSPFSLISILIPNYFGNQGTYNFWGQTDYVETVSSIGLLPIFLAIVSFGHTSKLAKKIVFFYLAATIITILLTVDWIIPRSLYALSIPLISTGVPTRIFMLTTFSLSVLAAIGFHEWFTQKSFPQTVKAFLYAFVLVIIGIVAATMYLFTSHASCPTVEITQCRIIALRNTLLEVFIFTVGMSLLISYRMKKIRILQWLVVGIVVGIGVYNSTKFLPFSPKNTFYPGNELITTIRNIAGYNRVFGLGSATLATDLATQLRMYDPQYYDPLYIRRYGELVSFANSGSPDRPTPRSDVEIARDINIPQQDIAKRRDRLLDLLSVRFLLLKNSEIASNSSSIYRVWKSSVWQIRERLTALPRAYLVHTVEVVRDRKALLKRLFDTSFDPDGAVLLEENPSILPSRLVPDDRVTVNSYQESKVIMKTHANQPGILVLTDNYYPGWKATVDGVEMPIYRANYAFRAVGVPEGDHTVIFFYYPRSLKLGIAVSGFSLFLFTLLILFRLSFNKRKKGFAVR